MPPAGDAPGLGFHHLAVQVRDLAAAEAFYAGLLGLPVIARHATADGAPRSVWVGLDGGGFLALERCDGTAEDRPYHDARPGLHLLALRIPPATRAAWEARLAAAGHPRVAATRFTFYVRDPEGNRVGLSHWPEEP
ncbi:MAG TPA: VOC family protein [Polyangia bacterium]|jgi:catechol 2,3-dioxygenase-like lactoylglutathione lyase family enzyme